jgi:hypothetical protein
MIIALSIAIGFVVIFVLLCAAVIFHFIDEWRDLRGKDEER